MTFIAAEKSVSNAAPIEAYKFTYLVNGLASSTYTYTTHNLPVVIAGDTYEPLPMSRSEVKTGTQTDDHLEMLVEMPSTTKVITVFAFSQSLPDLQLEVFRYHRGGNPAIDFALIWKGPVSVFEISGNIATIHSPNVFSRTLQSQYPSTNYQSQCNHILFGPLCKVLRSAHTFTSTVTSLSGRFVTVSNDFVVNNYLTGGELKVVRTGERRLMGNNTNNTLEINFRFTDIVVGDTVEFTTGCSHTYATCKTKFNNGVNFGGFPFVPSDNPFTGTIG
jgi:uncharacterized phage protein (TIGR02218 family)